MAYIIIIIIMINGWLRKNDTVITEASLRVGKKMDKPQNSYMVTAEAVASLVL